MCTRAGVSSAPFYSHHSQSQVCLSVRLCSLCARLLSSVALRVADPDGDPSDACHGCVCVPVCVCVCVCVCVDLFKTHTHTHAHTHTHTHTQFASTGSAPESPASKAATAHRAAPASTGSDIHINIFIPRCIHEYRHTD